MTTAALPALAHFRPGATPVFVAFAGNPYRPVVPVSDADKWHTRPAGGK